jgi:hypothetical protein
MALRGRGMKASPNTYSDLCIPYRRTIFSSSAFRSFSGSDRTSSPSQNRTSKAT